LGDVQIRLAISRIAVELRSQNLDRVVRLSVLAKQQRVACANRGIGRYFASASLPACRALGKSFAARYVSMIIIRARDPLPRQMP